MAVKPVIAYPGAKWKAWDKIKPLIPRDMEDWREPFLGGGSMSLSVAEDPEFNPKRMLVGDLAPEIWAFWKGVQESAYEVKEYVENKMREMCPAKFDLYRINEEDEAFKEIKAEAEAQARALWRWTQDVDCSKMNLIERAGRTYIVNKISFSGTGDSGSLSPSKFYRFNLGSMDRIIDAQKLLKKMEIRNCSFEETMADVDKDKTFVFLDPPYWQQATGSGRVGLYGRKGDTHANFPHEKFAELTQSLPCKWLVTYDDSVMVRRMFKDSIITPFHIKYTLAINKDENALAGEELFISNYPLEQKEDTEDILAML